MTVTFITGTDTEVGKTIAVATLAATHRAHGRRVAVVKPAQTGVAPHEPGDVDVVVRLAGPVDVVEGVRLPDPLAPDRAAVLAGVSLPTLQAQGELVRRAGETHDAVLVEGAGGVTIRLGADFTLLDLAAHVGAAGVEVTWFVVARAALGTLNHSALTVDAIRRRGFAVAGLVIGSWPARPGLAERHNVVDLERYTGVPVVGAIPAGAGDLSRTEFTARAPTWLRLTPP